MATGSLAPLILRNPIRKVGGEAPTNLPAAPDWPVPPPFDTVSPSKTKIDPRLLHKLGVRTALRRGLLPLRRAGAVTVFATSDPEQIDLERADLEALYGPVALARTSRPEIENHLVETCRKELVDAAETRTAQQYSCRNFDKTVSLPIGITVLLALGASVVAFPSAVFGALTFWAVFWLFATVALRVIAAVAAGRRPEGPAPFLDDSALPKIALLVPLFKEQYIADQLLCRLDRLDYPRDRLEICLVVEADDWVTRAALGQIKLPGHMRQIIVASGSLKTKPRAMNYAIDFVEGDIIGVYDAEDAPAADQLRVVAAEFAAAPKDVACLQGRLDFYNARTNWLSRCFTIDYATWFGVILPGLSKLQMVVPLGGTTVFFRRDILEKLGAWDAHNVTEDADLGVRLARFGWKTKLIQTTTEEEANCRAWPWIKQRSRWIKGYALTWAVHMRSPARLWADLGWRQFIGFQVVFLGSLSLAALAPVLWSFWLVLLGLPHPIADALPRTAVIAMASLFLLTEVCNITIGAWACRLDKHRWLIPWVPTMHFYFPLAAVAAWKGFAEIIRKPFFWDKTAHGVDLDPVSRPLRRA